MLLSIYINIKRTVLSKEYFWIRVIRLEWGKYFVKYTGGYFSSAILLLACKLKRKLCL